MSRQNLHLCWLYNNDTSQPPGGSFRTTRPAIVPGYHHDVISFREFTCQQGIIIVMHHDFYKALRFVGQLNTTPTQMINLDCKMPLLGNTDPTSLIDIRKRDTSIRKHLVYFTSSFKYQHDTSKAPGQPRIQSNRTERVAETIRTEPWTGITF